MTQISKAHGIQRLTEKKQKERAILDHFLSVVGTDSSAEMILGEEPDFIINEEESRLGIELIQVMQLKIASIIKLAEAAFAEENK